MSALFELIIYWVTARECLNPFSTSQAKGTHFKHTQLASGLSRLELAASDQVN